VEPSEYWQANKNLVHITPAGERFPEVGLYEALQEAVTGSVFEFGCGDGRLAPAFSHEAYTGYDINQHAIKAARTANPDHVFGTEWVKADTVLAYTVLLHIPDDEIQPIIDRMKQYKRIVIGEIMGREWRRPGNPPVFNRDLEEYVEMIGRQYTVIRVPYPRYGCDLELLVFEK
jgi:SAM-dependent methyltransferase